MKRVKDVTLVLCLFIFLLIVFGGCFRATPAAAFFGALAGTPVLVHAFNRLVPRRKDPESTCAAVARQPAEQVIVLRMERMDRREQ